MVFENPFLLICISFCIKNALKHMTIKVKFVISVNGKS